MAQTINLGSSQAPYWEYEKELDANEIWKLDYVTDSFHLLSTTTDNAVRVSFGGSMIETPFSAGMGYKLTEPVQFIQLQNITGSPVTVRFAVGVGNIRDDRLTVSGSVSTNITGAAGYSKMTAGTTSGNATFAYGSNADISFMATSGNITLNLTAGNISITGLTLPEGATWHTKLATAGTISVTATGATFNYCIAEY